MFQDPRRAVGAAVIVVALLALLVLNRVNGPDLPGRALALPPIPPPAAGACLVHSGAFDAVEIPCAQPHTAEVIRSWPAGRVPVVNGAAWQAACPTGATIPGPVGDAVTWTATAAQVATSILRGGGPVLGWAACARYPSPPFRPDLALHYRGSLAPDERGTATATVGNCLRGDGTQIDCTLPHPVERLGEFRSVAGRQPVESCGDFARRMVGSRAAFGAAGLLAAQGRDQKRRPGDGRPGSRVPTLTCEVHAPADRALVGTVVGLGDLPLPFG